MLLILILLGLVAYYCVFLACVALAARLDVLGDTVDDGNFTSIFLCLAWPLTLPVIVYSLVVEGRRGTTLRVTASIDLPQEPEPLETYRCSSCPSGFPKRVLPSHHRTVGGERIGLCPGSGTVGTREVEA